MDTMKEKDPQDQSTRPDPATGAPDAKPHSPSPATPKDEPERGDDDVGRRLAEQTAELARLAAELRQQREHFQTIEVSLVTRIADVDDDRRHAATRLQRTLQAQRDELDQRFKRQTFWVVLTLLLVALPVLGALVYFHVELNAARKSVTSQMTHVRDALAQIEIPATEALDPQTREKLHQLSQAVEEISSSLERIGDETETEPAEEAAKEQPSSGKETAAPGEASEPAGTTDKPADAPVQPNADANPSTNVAPPPAASPEPSETTTSGQTEPAPDQPGPPADASEASGTTAPSLTATPIEVGKNMFVVQVMGFYTLDSLREFVDHHGLPGEYFYRQETYQGRPWFVLIHSLHDSQKAAEAAVASLPPDLASLDIWVRKLEPSKQVVKVRKTGT